MGAGIHRIMNRSRNSP